MNIDINFFCQCSLSTPPLKTVLKFNLFYILFKIMSGPKIEVVKGIVPVCGLGEAPHWCPKEQVLYFVDIFNSRLLRYNPSNGVCNYVTVSRYIFFWIMQSITWLVRYPIEIMIYFRYLEENQWVLQYQLRTPMINL